MICHGGARRFHNAFGIDTVMCSDRLLQRRIAVSVVAAINFECVQMDWQFTKRKRRYAARGEIEPRAALRFGPIHVIGMLVSHDSFILVLTLMLVLLLVLQANISITRAMTRRRTIQLRLRRDVNSLVRIFSKNKKPAARPA